MFQFPGLTPLKGGDWIAPAGFPHSDISGSKPACGSPKLFAACHVLHRRSVPRHPHVCTYPLDQLESLLPSKVVSEPQPLRLIHSISHLLTHLKPLLPTQARSTRARQCSLYSTTLDPAPPRSRTSRSRPGTHTQTLRAQAPSGDMKGIFQKARPAPKRAWTAGRERKTGS